MASKWEKLDRARLKRHGRYAGGTTRGGVGRRVATTHKEVRSLQNIAASARVNTGQKLSSGLAMSRSRSTGKLLSNSKYIGRVTRGAGSGVLRRPRLESMPAKKRGFRPGKLGWTLGIAAGVGVAAAAVGSSRRTARGIGGTNAAYQGGWSAYNRTTRGY